MKKILLGTTGLIGAVLLSAAANAGTPKVTLGGFADFQAGFTSDDEDDNRRDTAFRNDNEVSIRVDGKTDGGLGYGAVIDLEADITDDVNSQGDNAARTFTYLEGGWGRVELGGNKSASATLSVDASSLAVATGGINGAWVYFVNAPAGGNTASFISTSRLPTEHGDTTEFGDESTYNATKVTYYTPKFSGFQAGISYTPDLGARGQTVERIEDAATPDSLVGFGDVINGGVTYDNQFANGLRVAVSVTGEYAEADDDIAAPSTEREDTEAYNIGGLLGYRGFSIAASYGDWSESGQLDGSDDEGDYYTVGAGYEAGPFGVSATYLSSQLDVAGEENEFDNIVLGADYKLAPGLTPYAEVSFYDFDEGGVGGLQNDGTTFLLGTQVAF